MASKKIIANQSDRVGVWVAERTGRTAPWGPFAAIGIEEDGELIGGFVIDNYVRKARVSIHAAGVRGKWVTRELLRVVFRYIFVQLGCKVIINTVNVDNELSMRGTAKLGFTEVLRVPNGAGSCDLAIFVMQKSDCKWL